MDHPYATHYGGSSILATAKFRGITCIEEGVGRTSRSDPLCIRNYVLRHRSWLLGHRVASSGECGIWKLGTNNWLLDWGFCLNEFVYQPLFTRVLSAISRTKLTAVESIKFSVLICSILACNHNNSLLFRSWKISESGRKPRREIRRTRARGHDWTNVFHFQRHLIKQNASTVFLNLCRIRRSDSDRGPYSESVSNKWSEVSQGRPQHYFCSMYSSQYFPCRTLLMAVSR